MQKKTGELEKTETERSVGQPTHKHQPCLELHHLLNRRTQRKTKVHWTGERSKRNKGEDGAERERQGTTKQEPRRREQRGAWPTNLPSRFHLQSYQVSKLLFPRFSF
jgi:hypothetical protein